MEAVKRVQQIFIISLNPLQKIVKEQSKNLEKIQIIILLIKLDNKEPLGTFRWGKNINNKHRCSGTNSYIVLMMKITNAEDVLSYRTQ